MYIFQIAKRCLLVALIIFVSVIVCKGAALRVAAVKRENTANEILNLCKDFSVSKTKSSTIYYTYKDKDYVKPTENIIKTYYPLLMSDMDVSKCNTVNVIFYPSEKDMRNAAGGIGRNRKMLPMGAYTAGIILILSPSLWIAGNGDLSDIDVFIKTGPVFHELVHHIFDEKTMGNSREWFSEGTALYYENKYTGYEWGAAKPNKLTLKELTDNFRNLDERESYGKSYAIVRYIADKKGEAVLKQIYADLERGVLLDKSLKKRVGSEIGVFNSLGTAE